MIDLIGYSVFGEVATLLVMATVATVPILPKGLSHEDMRTTLIQVTRTVDFRGRIAVASHSESDTADLLGAGADIVLEPFQDAAERAVELILDGGPQERPGSLAEQPT